jgi:DNA-binding transcriptional MerR regulator
VSAGAGTGTEEEIRLKIGEVCRLADVQPYVLRYWESEFPVLAPDRNATGPRNYSARELRIIERIKKLLYDEGYTIAGAKKRLDTELKNVSFEIAPVAGDLAASGSQSSGEESPTPPVPPPLPNSPSGAEGRGRRGRTRNVSAAPPLADEASFVFEETISPKAASAPVDPSTATVVQREDPRVALVITELKEVLALLSRSEP